MLELSRELKERFPDLRVLAFQIRGVRVERRSAELEEFKKGLIEEVREKHDLEGLKDDPLFRAYRDFFWRVGIDPTKNRPAGEALVRRVLRGKLLPTINTLVDAYNLASLKTGVPLAAFDGEKLVGRLLMRFAEGGEKFLGIGMERPIKLGGGEVVISDGEKLVAIYPYRDSDETKVTLSTRNVVMLVCGVPGVGEGILKMAKEDAVNFITRFCGGKVID